MTQLKAEQRERFLRMTPAERVALSERLGEEALRMLMASRSLDRATAIRVIRLSRRAGRFRSGCLDEVG
jgi:hypothetical protein